MPGTRDVGATRPDRHGYCFAFGAMDNYVTELQRCGEAIIESPSARIVPGHDYHCIAERLGGLLRFWIDGAVAYSTVDCLPLMALGQGCVALYSCATQQVFRDLRVWTRPTCIPPDTLRLMDALKRTILRVPVEPPRFVEIHYLRNFFFLFKEVTEVVEQQIKLETQQRESDKMEALLHLANAAAHEMNQPLTLLMGYMDLILQRADERKPVPIDQEELAALKEATNRMTAIVEKIGAIRRYRTKPYMGDHEILDIEASSRLTQITQKPPA
jgi:signal transduction histidine kinase